MIINFLVEKKCITVIIHFIECLQRFFYFALFQCLHRLIQIADIVRCSFMWEQYFILPVQPHKIILSLSEDSKQSLWNILTAFCSHRADNLWFFNPFIQFFRCPLRLFRLPDQRLHHSLQIFFILFCHPCRDRTVHFPEQMGKIQWRKNQRIQLQQKSCIEFMVKPVDIFLINLFIIILRMIMCLHKRTGTEIIHRWRDSRNRHREIIRPCLNRGKHSQPIRVGILWHSNFICKFFQKICIFISTADGIPTAVSMCRQFKVQICQHLSLPLRMDAEHLIPSSRRPVILWIAHTPFFCCQRTDHNRMPGSVTAL